MISRLVMVVMENVTFDALFGAFPDLVPEALPEYLPGLSRLCFNTHRLAVADWGGPFCRIKLPISLTSWYRDLMGSGALLTRCFSSVRGPSLPNHLMLMCAESPVIRDVAWDRIPPLPSIVDRIDTKKRTWKGYNGRPHSGLQLLPQLRERREQVDWTEFLEDARRGTLPNLSWVIPPFALSQHSPMPWEWGTAFLSQILSAVSDSPQWGEMLVMVVWDDWGGYYDHLPPPIVERWTDGTPFRDGFRVPAFLFSPHIAPGPLSLPCSSLSLLKLIEQLLRLEPLTFRDASAPSLLGAVNRSLHTPPPSVKPLPLPDPTWIDEAGAVSSWFDSHC